MPGFPAGGAPAPSIPPPHGYASCCTKLTKIYPKSLLAIRAATGGPVKYCPEGKNT